MHIHQRANHNHNKQQLQLRYPAMHIGSGKLQVAATWAMTTSTSTVIVRTQARFLWKLLFKKKNHGSWCIFVLFRSMRAPTNHKRLLQHPLRLRSGAALEVEFTCFSHAPDFSAARVGLLSHRRLPCHGVPFTTQSQTSACQSCRLQNCI